MAPLVTVDIDAVLQKRLFSALLSAWSLVFLNVYECMICDWFA